VADAPLADGVGQRPDDVLLSRDFIEALRAEFSG